MKTIPCAGERRSTRSSPRIVPGSSQADVTEGSGGIWERLHNDWSDPNRVVLATTDSSVWGGASGHTYTFTRQPNGTTDIDVVVVREGKNLKGRLLGFVVGTIGRRAMSRVPVPSNSLCSVNKSDLD